MEINKKGGFKRIIIGRWKSRGFLQVRVKKCLLTSLLGQEATNVTFCRLFPSSSVYFYLSLSYYIDFTSSLHCARTHFSPFFSLLLLLLFLVDKLKRSSSTKAIHYLFLDGLFIRRFLSALLVSSSSASGL